MQANQKGFTLIELIVVIVILGILAATALPKFIDLSSDARAGVIRGVEASMRGVGVMIYGKAAAKGELANTAATIAALSGVNVTAKYGYPANGTAWANLLDLNPSSDFNTGTANEVRHAKATDPANCKVAYAEASTAGGQPTYTATTSGC